MKKKSLIRVTARVLLLSLTYQLVLPVYSYALTTGPSSPEVQSFEPVGTTEMVDMFSGDFNYNIPLMDVEGYPINIHYHSGVSSEQEASWVGLGWNINPGEVNRNVRGLPDDFNGETIEKELHIEPETNYRVELGASAQTEKIGWSKKYGLSAGASASLYVNHSNYKGLSVGANVGLSLSAPYVSTGINVGVGSQTGADIDLNGGLHITKKLSEDAGTGVTAGMGVGTGFNSRTGLKDISLSAYAYSTQSTSYERKGKKDVHTRNVGGRSWGSSIPVGMQNYVPVVTNATVFKSIRFQVSVGVEAWTFYPHFFQSFLKSTLEVEGNGNRKGYGYLYSENAAPDAVLDFSREKDGYYNETMKNLPLSAMTYDVYSISGHGTGGMFRPFRNDIGSVFDPEVKSTTKSDDYKIEGGGPLVFEAGADISKYENEVKSGPWERLSFRANEPNSLFEKVFFKQAGELTYNNQQSSAGIYSERPVYLRENMSTLSGKGRGAIGSLPGKYGNANVYASNDRTSRSNLLTFLTGEQATIPDVAQQQSLVSYNSTNNSNADFFIPTGTPVARTGANVTDAKAHHITELTQTLPDGRRYIFGLPVINHKTREVTFSSDPAKVNISSGTVNFSSDEASASNPNAPEKLYSSTVTPAYAHSYLLTSVLSSDYVDVLGDGVTDDDIGSFTKFNYTLMDNDYRWRAPYDTNTAQYNPGFWSDKRDDKGNYITGSRQVWHLRSIESKNYIAEFYVSSRDDGKGVAQKISPSDNTLSSRSNSYKLDCIKLFNKHDRYINGSNAVPIKSVFFKYNYSLCPGSPNSTSSTQGKLTLERIYVRYGNSDKALLSPFVFTYSASNPGYSFPNKDRWGNYQEPGTSLTNYEFPYTRQEGTNLDDVAASWNLTQIKLPSGGIIKVQYEQDDYAFVQEKRAMEMFPVAGVGNSANFVPGKRLYENVNSVNNFVYFKRSKNREKAELSLRQNYLDNIDELYYSFNLDITNSGTYEHIKAYAKVLDLNVCPNDTDYCYIELQKERSGASPQLLHPATVYGINMARYYLPHLLYPGFNTGGGDKKVLLGLIAAAGELMRLRQNPVVNFVKKNKAKNIVKEKSWIKLQTPGLNKRGGGIRVKELRLEDSWQNLSSVEGADGVYGKRYEYKVYDEKYGSISSGVASYEPMIGGDENPCRKPSRYMVEQGRRLPAIEFFQEEPFGESFFPGASVGYSFVKVTSIHANQAKSALAEDEYEFYTAKDFPIEIDFTDIEPLPVQKTVSIRRYYEDVKVLQGYSLKLNDMHGKSRSIKNYLIKIDPMDGKRSRELVTAIKYNYKTDNTGKQLDNNVKAVVRNRGTNATYSIQDVTLGEEIDFTVDTRMRQMRSSSSNIAANVNTVTIFIAIVPIPTMFWPDSEQEKIFRSMVSTKIIQKYGILQSVETYDNGAKTILENVLWDSETGNVLLSRTNNEFNDNEFNLTYPAYWAYGSMGPSYTNVGYEEYANLQIEGTEGSCSTSTATYYGKLTFSHPDRFSPGDELLLTYTVGSDTTKMKVWVMDERIINYCPGEAWPYPSIGFTYKVAPRHLFKGANHQWPNLSVGDTITVRATVLRSGRRNQLDKAVQQTRLAGNPIQVGNNANSYGNDINQLLGASNAFTRVLDASVQTFTETASPYGTIHGETPNSNTDYDPDIYPVNIQVGSDNNKVYNRFVLGHVGNIRPQSNRSYIAKRNYPNTLKDHGVFDMSSKYWINANGTTSGRSILSPSLSSGGYWRINSYVWKYDVFGNAIEESDPTGRYSSSQYGYNKSLPVAIASNVRQKSFCFEGFEDFNMLVPTYLRELYLNSYYHHTPFASSFNTVSSTQSHYGQSYTRLDIANSLNDFITTTASHSGMYSLRRVSSSPYTLTTYSGYDGGEFLMPPRMRHFALDTGRKYIINMWVKPVSGSPSISGFSVTVGSNAPVPFQFTSGSLDGWYLAECILDLRTTNSNTSVNLNMPSGVYIDDVRFIPLDAKMKSFVYDPITFKLVAQLDENNMATFYEYDQEGILVRVKKETDKGIMTISENRRANSKKQ